MRYASSKVTQSVDLWSFGCVLSMAATWIVLGPNGIYQYRLLRQRAVRSSRLGTAFVLPSTSLQQSDIFHDGMDLLPGIRQWHQYLRGVLRRSDHITSNLLDFIEEHLLVARSESHQISFPKSRKRYSLNPWTYGRIHSKSSWTH